MKVSLETLYHFQCGECDRWWSIADFDYRPNLLMTCPHCGHRVPTPETVLTKDDWSVVAKVGDRAIPNP